ncbi:MAG TPA: poly-gamma-glutamate biosynthesis protein PgsC [Sandaracinaceae bacterium LLY-WYZ-13_1]|nr:poly-gamma-glutamate biosynthesis protein PgsC [Sandaracinaceae bacterium LLY-WYZ-13_1]
MSGPDLIVVSIAIGIVVSFVFSEVYGLAAGGVVVPGYIALYLDRPYPLAVTMLVAVASFTLTKIASQFLLVYGRRRTALTILVGFALGAWVSRFEALPQLLEIEGADATVIGYIIPGLIAIWFDRQGIVPTAASLTIAAVIVRLVLLLLIGPLALHATGAS